MKNNHSLMILSRDEVVFLRHWMYDEVHYREGQGSAKRLQVQHQVTPADLAVLIAATMPDPLDQEQAGLSKPPAESPAWPWVGDDLNSRVAEARAALAIDQASGITRSEVGPNTAMRLTGAVASPPHQS